ncbi:MAG TPA: hypothetical protein VIP51_11570 [Eoetvoesiella sp.]
MSVKRYDLEPDTGNGMVVLKIIPRENGRYVKYEDYAAVAKKLETAELHARMCDAIEAHRIARTKEKTKPFIKVLG